jgi:SOS regulatory protein LexA
MNSAHRFHSLVQFYGTHHRMPSYRELEHLWGFRSPNAARKVVTKFLALDLVAKDPMGRLLPGRAFKAVRVLGAVEAGFPSPAEEALGDTMDLDEFLIKNKAATYMLKVTGSSMIDAGILPGDMVLVERGLEAKDGDIVVAQIDHAWTLTYLRKRGRKVWLEPANKKYQALHPTEELKIAAVVIAVIRKYRDEWSCTSSVRINPIGLFGETQALGKRSFLPHNKAVTPHLLLPHRMWRHQWRSRLSPP